MKESLSCTPSTPILGKEESPLVVLKPTLKLELLAMDKNRSKDFRYVFVNAFGMRFGENDITLILGIDEGGKPEDMLQEVAVVMTPRTLKIFSNNLDNALKALESQMGEIPVPPGKLPSSFDEMIKTGIAGIEPARTAAVKKPKKTAKKPKK